MKLVEKNLSENWLTKELSFEEWTIVIKNNIKKYFLYWMSIMLFVAIVIRIIGTFYTKSIDYPLYLMPWVNTYSKMSFIEALRSRVTNYYVPYNIILIFISRVKLPPYVGISFVSCLADFIMAYYLYLILEHFHHNPRRHAFMALSVLLLPICFIDSAIWKQCDSIYAMFAIISVYYYVRSMYSRSFIFYSIGFCFKLQIIFLLPLYGMLWLRERNHSIMQFMWIPVLYFIGGLPSVLAGADIATIYKTYLGQIRTYPETSINYPNIWGLLPVFSGNPAVLIGEIVTILCLLIFLFINLRRYRMNKVNDCLWLIGMTVWTCTMFLPCMHERYDYLALIVLWLYGLNTEIINLKIAMAMQIIMGVCYTRWAYYVFFPILCAVYIWIYIMMLRGHRQKSGEVTKIIT